MTRIVNCRTEKYDVYIGRSSKWGNPFKVGRDGTRAEVIAMYRAWLESRPDLMASFGELRGRVLGCHCKPLACHGDVLVEFAERADT